MAALPWSVLQSRGSSTSTSPTRFCTWGRNLSGNTFFLTSSLKDLRKSSANPQWTFDSVVLRNWPVFHMNSEKTQCFLKRQHLLLKGAHITTLNSQKREAEHPSISMLSQEKNHQSFTPTEVNGLKNAWSEIPTSNIHLRLLCLYRRANRGYCWVSSRTAAQPLTGWGCIQNHFLPKHRKEAYSGNY